MKKQSTPSMDSIAVKQQQQQQAPLYTVLSQNRFTMPRKKTPATTAPDKQSIEDGSEHSTVTVNNNARHDSPAQDDCAAYSDARDGGAVRTSLFPSRDTRRSVTFYPYEEVELVPTVDEFTDAEIAAAWYSPHELSAIRQDAREIVEQADSGELVEYDDRLLGLEGRVAINCRKRVAAKHRAWDAVLDEQERQWDCFACDDEAIAGAYRKIAWQSQNVAYLIGRFHAREAQR